MCVCVCVHVSVCGGVGGACVCGGGACTAHISYLTLLGMHESQDLMSNVVKEQPEDLVTFLITVLRTKQGKKVGKAAVVTLSTAVLRPV